MQGAAAVLESALNRLGPISPIMKATSALQAQMIRPKPAPGQSTSLKLYPSLRQDGANKEKKEKTLRFPGPHDEDSIPAQVSQVLLICFCSGPCMLLSLRPQPSVTSCSMS